MSVKQREGGKIQQILAKVARFYGAELTNACWKVKT